VLGESVGDLRPRSGWLRPTTPPSTIRRRSHRAPGSRKPRRPDKGSSSLGQNPRFRQAVLVNPIQTLQRYARRADENHIVSGASERSRREMPNVLTAEDELMIAIWPKKYLSSTVTKCAASPAPLRKRYGHGSSDALTRRAYFR
jgi:hypothetical protein